MEMPLAKREFEWVRACVALQKILIVSVAAAGRPVTPKSVPPKIGPAGPILAENFAKIGPPGPLLLPK